MNILPPLTAPDCKARTRNLPPRRQEVNELFGWREFQRFAMVAAAAAAAALRLSEMTGGRGGGGGVLPVLLPARSRLQEDVNGGL